MQKSLTLYEIEDALVALVNCEGAVPDEQLAEYLSELAKASEQAVAKRDNVIRFLRHLDLQAGNIDTEIARLSALKASYESGKKRVEKYVVSVLEQLPEPKRGSRKLEGTVGVLSIQKNPDRVEITDSNKIPLNYQDVTVVMDASMWHELEEDFPGTVLTKKITFSPRRSDIKDAIQSGGEVPGADIAYGDNRLVVK